MKTKLKKTIKELEESENLISKKSSYLMIA
jgi:hypothetical protein